MFRNRLCTSRLQCRRVIVAALSTLGLSATAPANVAHAADSRCGPEDIDQPTELDLAVAEFVEGGTCSVISLHGDIAVSTPLDIYVVDEADLIQPVGRSLTIEGNGFELTGDSITSGLRVYLSALSNSSTFTVRNLGMRNFAGSGAMSVVSGATLIENSRFTDNEYTSPSPIPQHADASAGAVNAIGSLTVTDSEFADNTGSLGGAIYSAPTIELVPDAITPAEPPLLVSATTMSSNRATSSGGAVYALHSLMMTDSTVVANVAGSAGGINVMGSATLDFCTVVDNASLSNRAAVTASENIVITNSIVYGNSSGPADVPNGFADVSADGTVTVTSSLVTEVGTIQSTLFSTSLDTSNIVGTDPLLLPLGEHGGFILPGGTTIKTRPPQAGSPVIDVADITSMGKSALATDQRGSGFPRIVNGRADMGATEFQEVVLPDPPTDSTIPNPVVDDMPWSFNVGRFLRLPDTM